MFFSNRAAPLEENTREDNHCHLILSSSGPPIGPGEALGLRIESVHHCHPEHFDRLKAFLPGQSDARYSALAREMNTSEGAPKVARGRAPSAVRSLYAAMIDTTGSSVGIAWRTPDIGASAALNETAMRGVCPV